MAYSLHIKMKTVKDDLDNIKPHPGITKNDYTSICNKR